METVKITLNEQKYTINELPSRKNMEWREKLEQPFGDLADILTSAPSIQLDAKNLPKLADMLKVLVGRVAGAPGLMSDLLFEYCPNLAKQKEQILEVSFDSELIEAFAEVLKLAYPFGKAARLFRMPTGTPSKEPAQT